MKFETRRLDNGLEIVAECNPDAVSTAVGFFVRSGARDETPEIAGVSHFLEHMAFKGTETRTPDDINRGFDDIGAKYNAYTSEEHTVYHAAILPEYLPSCLDLLGDLIRPTLRDADFEMERQVIIEEIGMYADSPIWTAYERAVQRHFIHHPLGNSVLGTKKSVGNMRVEAMKEYHAARYSPSNMIVGAAGNVDFEALVRIVEDKCGAWTGPEATRNIDSPTQHGDDEIICRPEFVQQCLCMVGDAPPASSPLRFAAELVALVIGDETGSRFYWSLLDPGEVENADMGYHEYEGAGAFIISASSEPGLIEDNLDKIREILADVTANGVTEDELRQAKNKASARMVLSAERPYNRLYPIGYNWLFRREYRSLEEDLADLNAVTTADVAQMLVQFPLEPMTGVTLGPIATMRNLPRRTGAVGA